VQVGSGPFLDGLRGVDGPALAAALALGGLTTVGSAWRWRFIAAGLGSPLRMGDAVAAYYRSQLLNLTLPGGVVGDVHRAVRHGVDIGDVGLGVRAAVWDRLAGQVIQVTVALAVLAAVLAPVGRPPWATPAVVVALLAAVAIGVVVTRVLRHEGDARSRWNRLRRRVRTDLRDGVLADHRWVGVVAASTVVVGGHVATFVLAARTAGTTAPLGQLVPLALLVLLAMAVPLNIAGWGPREGVAAWAFGVAGLGAAAGLAAAVTYGVLVLFASLPGAVVLLIGWLHRRPIAPSTAQSVVRPRQSHEAAVGSGVHG
jgi:uncharacterized membrane protein YbhN (UPF0104 family)